ncbi:MAG: MiaB/RimO family radical SAM methylthiotransferase [bacterium]
MPAAVITIGCRLNQAESDCLRGRLLSTGTDVSPLCRFRVSKTLSPEKRTISPPVYNGQRVADAFYINTCAVTRSAERSSLAIIRQVCRLKPKPKVVVLGCLAQISPARIKAITGVDEVWDNQQKQEAIDGAYPVPERSRALLKVQDGCDRGCTYCVVSRLRGKPVSVPLTQVIEQFEQLIENGFQEVVLTGLNLGRYRRDDTGLAGLLSTLLKRPGRFRIRLASVEPDLFDDDLIEIIADPKVCDHFHIPIQSGDDRILKSMGRRYTTRDYARLLTQIVRVKPDACIGTDVIVGFPGEDEDSFAHTYDFLSKSAASYFHIFPYSLRPGTPAFRLGDPVTKEKKQERVRRLRQLSEQKRFKYAQRFFGQIREAVLEPKSRALTDNYLRLFCPGLRTEDYQKGRLAKVTIGQRGEEIIGRSVMDLSSDLHSEKETL